MSMSCDPIVFQATPANQVLATDRIHPLLRRIAACLLMWCSAVWLTMGWAQAQTTGLGVDTSFTNTGADMWVYAMATQPDGKVLLGGSAVQNNSTGRSQIVRVNSDGSLDASFAPRVDANANVWTVALQPNGKVLVGGNFTTVNNTPRASIARLNANGSLDTSFNVGTGANGNVYAMSVQSDGKVLIGGDFSLVNGVVRYGVARLNADGSVDTSFNPGSGANGNVLALTLEPYGKVLIGGEFTKVNGITRTRIARLNPDGSVDMSFNVKLNNDVSTIAWQPDGKVLIGGNFTLVNAMPTNRIARLSSSGALDITFNGGTGANDKVQILTLQPNGQIMVGGSFTNLNGTPSERIARLNTDGTIDTSFRLGAGADGQVHALTQQSDGKLLIGGLFTHVNGTPRNSIARLITGATNTGAGPVGKIGRDTTFSSPLNHYAATFFVQPDGKILVGGYYFFSPHARVTRLNTNGSADYTFNPGAGANGAVSAVDMQFDGKILIAGAFTAFNNTPRNYIARLNNNGSLDTAFNPGEGPNAKVNAMKVQADGKVLMVGDFTMVNGTARNRIARLNADGSLDLSFNPGTGADGPVHKLILQPDGKILIAGNFLNVQDTPRDNLVRLNPDGSLDTSFEADETYLSTSVSAIALQIDGKLLISSEYATATAGVYYYILSRLNTDGSWDDSFDTGYGLNGKVAVMTVQPDGKILIGGEFTTLNGAKAPRFVRLNSDGIMDPYFNPGSGVNDKVSAIQLLPDGKAMIAGDFNSFNGQGMGNGIGRLISTSPTP